MMYQITQWSAMGGYGAYVWPAYGIVAITLTGIFFSVKRQKKRTNLIMTQWFKSLK